MGIFNWFSKRFMIVRKNKPYVVGASASVARDIQKQFRFMQRIQKFAITAIIPLTLAGCFPTQSIPAQAPVYPREAISMISPSGPGSGYDLTIRAIAKCLLNANLVSVPLPITAIPGGGGVVALEFLERNRGSDDVIAIYSPPINLIHLNGSTSMNHRENTTPIARLVVDYGIFAVRKDSPYQTLGQVMDALKADPRSVRVAGISAFGSMDHLQFLKTAHAAGVTNLNQIPYTGYQDGTSVAQLLGGHVDLVSTGISDSVGLVESGDIRALAVTSERRVGEGIVAQVPTCIEQGIDATFITWRGIFGPPEMPGYALEYWENTLAAMVKTDQWAKLCSAYGWDMAYLGHDDFSAFLNEMDEEYGALLRGIGFVA